ncbi:MAG TPA: lysylphosphatidylglycerol synthase transmembrane domain-containing protein [Ignavibacteriaceae bacterium]|nr:lysylphosphatidylglycerol synthase transmembrane domain-containing protein [Ignavibacteriaceae bacterium]
MTSDKRKRISIKEIVSYAISILLAVVFLLFAFNGVNSDEVISALENISVWWIIVFIILTLFAHLLRAIRWRLILSSVKKDISVNHLFGSLLIGYGVNSVIPRLGEVSKAVSVGQIEGISRSSIFGTIVVERIIDIIFFGLSVVVSGLIYKGDLYHEFTWLQPTIYFGLFAIVLIVFTLYLTIRFREKFYSGIILAVGIFSESFAKKLAEIFDKLIAGFSSLRGVKNTFFVLLISLLIMVVYAVTSLTGFYVLGMQSLSNNLVPTAWIVMSISAIGIMIPTPGGIGSYHTITKSLLVNLFAFGEGISMAYAALTHVISYSTHLIGAAIYFFAFRKKYSVLKRGSLFKLDETNQ